MSKDLVSIITPTYNCAKFIGATIESVLNQTYQNFEMIIVDDASKDNTEEVVKSFKDKRIKYIRLSKNSGPAVARNRAMEEAKGKYMAFLDSDDLWKKEKLEKQINFIKKNKYKIICSDYEQIDEEGNKLNKIIPCKKKVNYNGILLSCPVGNSTVFYDVSKLGKFKVPNIRKRNDDALWLQILKKEEYMYGQKEVLMEYRIRQNSVSSNKLSLIKYHWQLYREIEHLSVIRSVFHIVVWGFIKVFHIK
mgnify:FL=1